MNNYKLFNRNFILIVIGQMIAIFGNSVLRFALPLYILQKTGSTTVFGSILAISTVPTILFSPFGGILADRINRKYIMVCLDFIMAIVIVTCGILLSIGPVVIIVTIMMIFFSVIQSFYSPAVQASVPVIVNNKDLEKANSVVSTVNAVSNIFGPLAAGILYALWGIWPILITGGICFTFAAIMEIFLKMKFVPKNEKGSAIKIIKTDFKDSLNFISKEKPVMLKTMIIIAGMNLFLTSMFTVGMPAMICIKLGLSSKMYGFSEGFIAVGMIIGGVSVSLFSKKVNAINSYILLIGTSVGLIPIGLAFMLKLPTMAIYYLIIICTMVIMALATMFIIIMNSFVQRETPNDLVGKVIAYTLVICQCSIPIGQAIYGVLFEKFSNVIYLIILITGLICGIIAIGSKTVFKGFEFNGSE